MSGMEKGSRHAAPEPQPLAERLLDSVPAVEESAKTSSTWRDRRKSSFDLTDLYGDP